ncbi:MAG TPA: YceI family protein [Steroidobacteraceae bacterium]|nr:YceI family protein [Steroidobacteraceae bacterium]
MNRWMRPAHQTLAWSAFALLAAAAADGAPPSYTAEAAQSRLQFTGVQAGAEFKAVFHKFTAAIDFAPEDLGGSRFDVLIDLASVDSEDSDRDSTIRGPDIFDLSHFPKAHYLTRGFTKTASGYSAVGALTLRGVTKDVPIDFQFTANAAGAKLDGSASLKRLDFGAGQGDWKSTDQIKDEVKINFSLVLTPKH